MTTTPADGHEPNRPDGGPLAPTAPGTTPRPALTLTHPQKLLIGFVIFGAVAIAAIGFIGSYTAVTQLAYAKGFGAFSRVFTLGIDLGIGVFLALDLLLTWLRMPYPALRYGAWLLTAATIAFNAVVSWPDPVGVGMHAVIPILFVVSVEAARHAIGRMADITADKHLEGPPFSRWLLNPLATFILWRRQRLWAIRRWDTVLELERERRIYIGKLRKEHGRWAWRRKATADQMLVLSLAKDGMSVQDAIELPEREAQKLAEAEAKREAEARAKSEAEAEAKHQAELRRAEAEAKRRAEIAEAEAAEARARAEAEAAEAEAKHRVEAAAEAARLEVEAKRRAEAEAARILEAETEAKLAAIARQQKNAQAEAELKLREQAVRAARIEEEQRQQARRAAEEAARERRAEQARAEAQRLAAQARTTSGSTSTSGTSLRPDATSASGSGSAPRSIAPQRGKRQAEVEVLLARMVEAGDPKCVSLEDVMRDFDLKQTTAYDRLSTAQQLWSDAQPEAETA